MEVIVRLLEFIVAVEIGQMMVPLGGALDLHLTKRIRAFHFEDADSTYAMGVGEHESIRRTSHDVVSEHPDARRFHHIIGHVLICVNRHRLMIHTPLDGRHMVQILWGVDLVAETLDVR